jgi:cobalt-zinc-cadmium efflux system membrane fusion protein
MNAASRARAQATWSETSKRIGYNLAVLGTLAAIGAWGHATHWSFSRSHATITPPGISAEFDAESPSGDALPLVIARSEQNVASIEFPTVESIRALGMETVRPEQRSVLREITATAAVSYVPSRTAQLSSRVPGTLWRVERRTGDAIRAGDVLAVIDSPAVGQAKANFLTAIADVELKKKAHDRLQSFGKGEVARKQVEEAETELRKSRVELFNSQQTLISLGLKIKLEEWQNLSEADLELRIKFLGVPDSIVSGLDPDATTATLLPIFAPFDGIVIGHTLAKGEVVSPTQTHFQIADVSQMWIVLDVRETDADALQLGQRVTFSSGSATVNSTLSWISTEVDAKTRTVEARCVAENPLVLNDSGQPTGQQMLRANQFGIGRIQVHENANALVVPTKAVQRSGPSQVVFVQTGERAFEAREVGVGVVADEFTEIIEGLAPGIDVVTVGSHVLKAELQRRYTAANNP